MLGSYSEKLRNLESTQINMANSREQNKSPEIIPEKCRHWTY
jgi:hypothetical protein